jgi:DNA-binding CsgD family transcriptional regulator/tetratricopeptide (TPR) repeat protein
LEEALARFNALGDKYWANHVPGLIPFVYYQQGNLARARQGFEQFLPYARESRDRGRLVVVLGWLGDIERASSKYDLAKKYYSEYLEIARQIGDKGKISGATYCLGFVSLYENDLNSARLLFTESLTLRRELKLSTSSVEWGLFGFACLAAAEKQARRAVRLFAPTDCLFLDKRASQANEVERKRYLAMAREQLDEAAFTAAWKGGKAMTLEQAIAEAEQETVAHAPAPAPALPRDPNALTPRELEVLRLVAAGLSDAQVAAKLIISRRTVSTHLTAIYGKLGVTSRSAATRCALDRKLV